MIIISDSSPLISLAIIRKLHLLEQIFDEIWMPQAVYQEIAKKNKPYSSELERFSENRIKDVQNRLAVQLLLKELDIGEAEAIVLALETNIKDVLIDEYKGRKVAQSCQLETTGTIGVLLQAKKKGLITEVKADLDELICNHCRISQPLYEKALELAGEKSSS